MIITFCSDHPGGFLCTTHEEVPETLPNALPFQLSPGAPRIQGGPIFPPAHQGRGRTVRLAGQYGCLVHRGIHYSWSRLNGGHRCRGHRGSGCWGPVALRGMGRETGGGATHCGSPHGRPHWCCPQRCGQCSCSHRHRPCSGPAAGGTCPALGTGCGHLPVEPPRAEGPSSALGGARPVPRHQLRGTKEPVGPDSGRPWETDSCGMETAPTPELCLSRRSQRGLMLRSGAELPPGELQSWGPQQRTSPFRAKHREPQ